MSNRKEGKRISGEHFFLTYFVCARLWRAISGEKSETRGRDMELMELNTTHKLQRGGPSWSETNGGQEFNFISQ